MASRRLAVLVAVLATLATMVPGASIAAKTPAVPDLGMAHLRKFTIGVTPSGHKRLRFSTKIINIGDGPFEAFGHNPQPDGTKLVNQRIYHLDGTLASSTQTDYRMYFAGDGHHHWHLRDLEGYVIKRLHTPLGRGAKEGFCFMDGGDYDLTLPHAPQNPVFTGCGTATDVNVTMGLSVGWVDTYGFMTVGQYIDITGLPDGRYRVTATADALSDFVETCEDNNSTTATIQITGNTVTVVYVGKDSRPC